MNMQNIESRCYRTRKYTVCRRVHATFSPDVLQAVKVKGLIELVNLAWSPPKKKRKNILELKSFLLCCELVELIHVRKGVQGCSCTLLAAVVW